MHGNDGYRRVSVASATQLGSMQARRASSVIVTVTVLENGGDYIDYSRSRLPFCSAVTVTVPALTSIAIILPVVSMAHYSESPSTFASVFMFEDREL